MNKKNKFIIATALIYLLSLPSVSFSEVTNRSTKKHSGLYISGQYKPSVSVFSSFSIKETNAITKNLIALKKEVDSLAVDATANSGISKPGNFTMPYIAAFEDNAFNFNGAIGYTFTEGPRIEIEGFHEEFDAKNPGGYGLNDAFRYFALARDMSATQNKFEPKDQSSSKVFHTVMRNDGLSIISIMVNSCYDFSSDNLLVSPYICGGIGVDAIEFFDALHIKLACQGKLGITYQLSYNISLFADGYYHQVIGNQFRNLNVQHVAELNDAPKVTSAVATLNVGYFGAEVGVRFIF
ncbi:surface antigen family protein [Ehrlichia chaffeensis str. Heartland]|uniref:P44/Msp2 family outer membrane protein n=1 Tax=Ehrlichia chaffeensis TaxID=945 RepID=UPI000444C142|nr:P44/Msp2 family outer membrane protein [Ehrlichia chaffeensis]AHX03229.1 surface antigen family protein [Ehrlichia chaffeensis str. Heartland]AHX08928.1 surface antigen family protein [Ehrlichia chaffeensis str. Saint Vincent]AHX10774.1 surface antigen family protein [Ehrlichia chaffeensis str. West Paces]